MQIVKKFDLEMAHIVRNAWSTRCSKSIHGHTYTVEVVLERSTDGMFDEGQMVIDFGLVKKYIGPFIDSFDHATMLWDKDPDPVLVEFFKEHFNRVIVCNQSSSCEMMSAILLVGINELLACNDETDMIDCVKVIVHETKSGRAECDESSPWVEYVEQEEVIETMFISQAIKDEWPEEFVEVYNESCFEPFGRCGVRSEGEESVPEADSYDTFMPEHYTPIEDVVDKELLVGPIKQRYYYQALDCKGEVVAGTVDAEDETKAIFQLRSQGLYPTVVSTEDKEAEAEQKVHDAFGLLSELFGKGFGELFGNKK